MAQKVDCPLRHGARHSRGDSDDKLVTNVEQSVLENHPDMVRTMSREQIGDGAGRGAKSTSPQRFAEKAFGRPSFSFQKRTLVSRVVKRYVRAARGRPSAEGRGL